MDSDYIDINTALYDREKIARLVKVAIKEKDRVGKQMEIADKSERSDRKDWKHRYEALVDLERVLERLSVNVLVTSGKIPLI